MYNSKQPWLLTLYTEKMFTHFLWQILHYITYLSESSSYNIAAAVLAVMTRTFHSVFINLINALNSDDELVAYNMR